jgi:hypothetical protein
MKPWLGVKGSYDISTIRYDFIKANKTVGNFIYFNSLFKITETAHFTNLYPYYKKIHTFFCGRGK